MIDVISTVSTNVPPALMMKAAGAAIGGATALGLTKSQIGMALVAVRWMHLEAPTIGRAIYAAGAWLDAHGGVRTILARLAGPKPPKGGTPSGTPVQNIPLNSGH